MQKKCQVVIFSFINKKNTFSYQIYILSEDEVKKGDWIMYGGSHDIHHIRNRVKNCVYTDNDDTFNISHKSIKKIIASTNNSLGGLPNLSNESIEICMKQSQVDVEYIYEYPMENGMFNHSKEPVLKVKIASDNTISISPIKKTWCEEDLPIQAIKDCLKYCEEQQIYDKLSTYNDFYYKLKQFIK